jgi:hypothetical protein
MLNHIISLQADVKIITNKTMSTLNLLAKQSTEMCNAIYQNHLALYYLLASEGEGCGKFNLSNCYLQIDDEGKVIEEITDQMRKLTHVPAQTWKGWNPGELLGGWFSTFGGFKTLISTKLLILGACLVLPFVAPLIVRSVSSLIKATIERNMASHVMMLWKHKPLNQDHTL